MVKNSAEIKFAIYFAEYSTAAFSAAHARRNDGDGAAMLSPDLRWRCDRGDTWLLAVSASVIARSATVTPATTLPAALAAGNLNGLSRVATRQSCRQATATMTATPRQPKRRGREWWGGGAGHCVPLSEIGIIGT